MALPADISNKEMSTGIRIPREHKERRQRELDSGLCDIEDWQLFLGYAEEFARPCVPLGVFIHIFYDDLADEIAGALRNIPYDFRAYVSTSDEEKRESIARAFQSHGIEDVVIKVAPNAGWDIGPFLFAFTDDIRAHDICLRLHSKKSPHQGAAFGTAWRRFLLDELVGSRERVERIVDAFVRQPDLGVLIPPYWERLNAVNDVTANWLSLEPLMARIGISIDPVQPIQYPCGSMFWFRAGAIEPLLRLSLAPNDFENFDLEAHDGTLAHAIERVFLYSAARAGFSWAMSSGMQTTSKSVGEIDVHDYEQLIRASGVFDIGYYTAQHPGTDFTTQNPIRHYLAQPASEASPFVGFNARYYRRLALQHDGWTGNPLVHYLLKGRSLGFQTAPAAEMSLADSPYAGAASSDQGVQIVGGGLASRTLREFCAGNVVRTYMHQGRAHRKALALFAMHEPRGLLTAYRRQLLSALQDAGFDIAIINSTELRSEAFLSDARDLSAFTVIRRTVGRDFASWVVAHWELRDVIPTYEHVLWSNDSIFGPYRPLKNLCADLIAADVDCAGLTDSWESSYHLQSYFLLFKTDALLQSPLRRFIQDYSFPDNKHEIIAMGELGLSQAMMNAGLSFKAQYPYSAVSGEWLRSYTERLMQYKEHLEYESLGSDGTHAKSALEWLANVSGYVQELQPVNPTHFFWDTLITRFGFPFVKKELLALNPARVPNIGSLCEVLQPISQSQFNAILENLRSTSTGKAPPWQPAQRKLTLA